MANLLFVCTNSKHRSVTAAKMLSGVHETRFAGLAPTCENPVTEELVKWADKVYCFEDRHKRKLRKRFGVRASNLGVPDEYSYNDPSLREELTYRFGNLGLM